MDWILDCPGCGSTRGPEGLPTVCGCGQPWLVRYPDRVHPVTERAAVRRRHGMWRYRSFLPLGDGEEPVTLGEGDTPLLPVPRTGAALGFADLWIKDEATNPTGSFKARGLSAAITRATGAGCRSFVIPTAGNAGVAASAYAARAGAHMRVFAPEWTPPTIRAQIETLGGELVLISGHIGQCGVAAREYAEARGAMDLSTLREPYRIEGKKTLGLELALQYGWEMPGAIIYPTGGGTGLIGMWKAFGEMLEAGWVVGTPPRMFSVQAEGCAPIVRAYEAGEASAEAWADPVTAASGLRVPKALGDRLILSAIRESGGGAVAVSEADLEEAARRTTRREGIDMCPEGGAALAGAVRLVEQGILSPEERIVVFNTGAGWLYR